MSLWQEPPASATTQDSIRDSQLFWRVCPACAVSCGKISVLDHLPESVAGAAVFDPTVRFGTPGTCDPPQSVSSVRGVLWENSWVRQLVCPMTSNSDVIHSWVRQLVCPMMSNSDVIRWSMKGGASIPPCTSGTIFRSG